MKFICLGTRFLTGGASQNAVIIAKSILAQGHDCEVWFLLKTGDMDTEGVKTRIFSNTRPRGLLAWFKLFKSYFQAIIEHRADSIISFYPLTNVLGSLSKLCGGTRHFVATQRNPLQKQSKPILLMEMLCGMTKLYDANIAVSHSVAATCDRYPKKYKNKVCVVYNGVPPLLKNDSSIKECRQRFGLPSNGFLAGSLGRLDTQKNVSVLIEMMALTSGMHLAIAGTGHLEKNLKDLCASFKLEDRITFLGNLSGENVFCFYRALDVFCFATHYEGFGRTMVEAFSVGTPVIASDIPVLREVGGDAAIYADNNAQSWSEKVLELKENSENSAILAAAGRHRARLFALDTMVKSYISLATPRMSHRE